MKSPRVNLAASFFLLAAVVTFAPRAARAQDAGACTPACLTGEVCVGGTCMTPACRPACAAGETCVSGTCMVPAARTVEEPAPPAVAPPPPVAPPPVRPHRPAPTTVEVAEPPSIPTVRNGAFIVPQVGVSSFLEDSADDLSPGLRLAALAGGYLTNEVSLGGTLTFDLMNWDTPSNVDASGFMLEAAFTPLFHAGDQRAEFVIGPAIGAWMASAKLEDSFFGDSASVTAQGWALGGNMGLFSPLWRNVRVGALINFMVRETAHVCATLNGSSACQNSGPAHQVIGFSAAAML